MKNEAAPLVSLSASQDGTEVELHLGESGVRQLINELEKLERDLKAGECEHTHLMTESWGWSGLSESKLKEDHKQVFHLKIYAWTQEWRKKHGL